MKATKNWAGLLAAMGLVAGLAIGGAASASMITLTPSNTDYLDIGSPNQEPELFGMGTGYAGYTTDTDRLELLYKSDFVEAEDGAIQSPVDSGTFATSYTTTFDPTDEDPTDATITWVIGNPHITCPDCYLAIKDGAFGYYTFNLKDLSGLSQGFTGAWDGKTTIFMDGFWAGSTGAISHVAIWGKLVPSDNDDPGEPPAGVPEPMPLALFGAGLLGLGWAMRRRNQV